MFYCALGFVCCVHVLIGFLSDLGYLHILLYMQQAILARTIPLLVVPPRHRPECVGCSGFRLQEDQYGHSFIQFSPLHLGTLSSRSIPKLEHDTHQEAGIGLRSSSFGSGPSKHHEDVNIWVWAARAQRLTASASFLQIHCRGDFDCPSRLEVTAHLVRVYLVTPVLGSKRR